MLRSMTAGRVAGLCALALALPLLLLTASVRVAGHRTGDHDEPDEPPEGWYWGSVDANIDWCERNYSVTPYVAELWNALSSLPIFFFALAGYIAGRKYSKCEDRFRLGYAIMMLVGLGSFMFHATLRRYAQCMDELPMLWAAIVLFYNSLDYKPRGFGGPPGAPVSNARRIAASAQSFWEQAQYRGGLKLALFASGVTLTIIYFYLPSLFLVFFIGYSTFLMSFCVIMGYHIWSGPRNVRRRGSAGSHGYEPVSTQGDGSANGGGMVPTSSSNNRPYTRVLGKLFWGAIFGYFGGFVFWSYENTFCSSLPNWAQLHALWHIMAGLGTFCAIQCQIAWRAEELGGKTSIDMDLGGHVLPIVVVKYDN